MGLDSLIVKDIIHKINDELEILGTSFFLRVFGSIFITVVSCLIVFVIDKGDSELLKIVFITSFSYIFLSFDVIDFYFQSRLESKYTVIAKFIAFIFSSFCRIFALLNKMPLITFVTIALIEVAVGACVLIAFYAKKTNCNPINWSINFTFLKLKLSEAWPLILSGMVIMIYMRIDQIMLKQLIGEKPVGTYSVAVTISEVWYLIPIVISTSVYPRLLLLRINNPLLYKRLFEVLYSIYFIISFGIGIVVTIFSSNIIALLYGSAYSESSLILKINIWAGVFVFLGVASGNYMVMENLNKISFYKTFIGAIFNVFLNFVLIPLYSGAGAATATLFSYAIAAYLSNFLFAETRPLFYSMTKSIVNSFRISNYKLYENESI
ncbi:polysaccharide biosynthesis protein [mine drainage metagenome]|uniref:Polysaccharide biosynthesis protein n=1 Tax=mine drainage metagenome TaxID=410659 RepID=A0A1J5P0Q2_9ZZZZ